MIDLWPNELSTVDQRSPLTILKEQASLLGEKTQNIVIAVLEYYPSRRGLAAEQLYIQVRIPADLPRAR